MKLNAVIEKFPGAGMHFLAIPTKTATALHDKGVKRVLCRINDTLDLHAALKIAGKIKYGITSPQQIMKS